MSAMSKPLTELSGVQFSDLHDQITRYTEFSLNERSVETKIESVNYLKIRKYLLI